MTWCVVRVKPNRRTARSPFYTPSFGALAHAGLVGHSGCLLGRLGLGCAPLWAKPFSAVGLVSFKETGPLLLLFFFIFYLICLQFKFSLNWNLNFVSIHANLCNLVEYFVI
jgi:hypothetical protein